MEDSEEATVEADGAIKESKSQRRQGGEEPSQPKRMNSGGGEGRSRRSAYMRNKPPHAVQLDSDQLNADLFASHSKKQVVIKTAGK